MGRKRSPPASTHTIHLGVRGLRRNISLFLSECQDRFDNGNPQGLLDAIRFCAQEGLLPGWVAKAFLAAHARHEAGETLDEAFGFDQVKRKHRFSQQLWAKRHDICRRIKNLRSESVPLSKAFAEVAPEFNIAESTCRKIYYATQRHAEDYLNRLLLAGLKQQGS